MSHKPEVRPAVIGVTAADDVTTEEEVFQLALSQYARTAKFEARRQRQTICFPRGPVGLVFMADLHLGGEGTNVARIFSEAEIVAQTPGLWLVLVGDLLDNFVLAKLAQARHNTNVTIPGEWSLLRRFLRIVGPKLLASVAGNHEHWLPMLTGIDYFRTVLAQLGDGIIYDRDDARFLLSVGEAKFPLRVRHKWRGTSIWNDTHQIERAARFDHDFICGIGAHTHASGEARTFNLGGQNAMAVLCGSYKPVDTYARRMGFHKPNQSTAITVLFDECGSMVGIDNLNFAAQVIQKLR